MKRLLVLLVALTAASWSQNASALENARDLAIYCGKLERGTKGAGRHIRIPNTKEALLCWGYMLAIQDVSILAHPDGHRIMGSCPPEQTTVRELIRSFVKYPRSRPAATLEENAAAAVLKALQQEFPCS